MVSFGAFEYMTGFLTISQKSLFPQSFAREVGKKLWNFMKRTWVTVWSPRDCDEKPLGKFGFFYPQKEIENDRSMKSYNRVIRIRNHLFWQATTIVLNMTNCCGSWVQKHWSLPASPFLTTCKWSGDQFSHTHLRMVWNIGDTLW